MVVLHARTRVIAALLNVIFVLMSLHQAGDARAKASDEQDDPIVFTVGDDSYRLTDFRDFILARPSLQGLLQSHRGIRRAVEEMIDSKIFKKAGIALEIPSDGVGTETDQYYFAVQNRIVLRCAPPTDDELKAFFESDPVRFATPVLTRISRIMLPNDIVVSGQNALEFLRNRKDAIVLGAISFDSLVDEATKVVSSAGRAPGVMGDLGFAKVGGSEEGRLDDDLRVAPKGAVIGPFEDGNMVFLVQVTDRRESIPAAWPQIKDEVERVFMMDCRSRNLDAKRGELMRQFNVELDETVLKQIRPVTDSPF